MKGNGRLVTGAFQVLSHCGQSWEAEAMWSHRCGELVERYQVIAEIFRSLLIPLDEIDTDGNIIQEGNQIANEYRV